MDKLNKILIKEINQLKGKRNNDNNKINLTVKPIENCILKELYEDQKMVNKSEEIEILKNCGAKEAS